MVTDKRKIGEGLEGGMTDSIYSLWSGVWPFLTEKNITCTWD